MRPNYKRDFFLELRRLPKTAPVLMATIAWLLIAEIVVILICPLAVPGSRYLSLYLSSKAVANFKSFLDGNSRFLIFDEHTGWKNRPGVRFEKWEIDSWGSRTTHQYGQNKGNKSRVIFLGSSLTNGGTEVSTTETISSEIADENIEALNFATMMYSIDQSYLAYKHRAKAFEPDLLIVGLSSEPAAGIVNRYVPFHYRSEESIPFIKPMFHLTGATLGLHPVPQIRDQMNLLVTEDLLDEFKRIDHYWWRFDHFYHFKLMPLSAGISSLWERSTNIIDRFSLVNDSESLLLALLLKFQEEANGNGHSILYLLLPDKETAFPSSVISLLPDRYHGLLAIMENNNLPIFDSRPVLRGSIHSPDLLFHADGSHYTALGNKVIADALKRRVKELLAEKTSN